MDTPTGTVEFFDGTTSLGAGEVNNGLATISTSDLIVGKHNITAIYSGDDFYSAKTLSLVQTIQDSYGYSGNKSGSETSISSSECPSLVGQDITFTALVTPVSPATGTPTGTVKFYVGTTLLDTRILDENGVATIDVSNLPNGHSNVTAIYSGDDDFISSTDALSQEVTKNETTTTLSVSSDSSVAGGAVTLTAAVSASSGNSTGTVTFFDGNTELATAPVDGLGNATTSVDWLSVAMHTITAHYNGDDTYRESDSNGADVTVSKGDTTVNAATLIDTSDSEQFSMSITSVAAYGQTVTLAAYLSPTSPAAGIPSGTVTFYEGETELGTANVNGNGNAFLDKSDFALGSHTITAVYSGDANFNAGTSLDATINVVGDILWRDAFTDADYTNIDSHTPDAGSGGYTTLAGGMGVDDNKLKATSFGSGIFGSYVAASVFDSGAEQSSLSFDFSLDYNAMALPVDVFVILRYDPSSQNGFVARITSTGMFLYQLSSGSLTQLDYVSLSLNLNTAYTLTAANSTSGVSVTVDGLTLSFESTTGNTETRIGFGFVSYSDDESYSWIDNLVVTA